ncbi:MAG: hypothetical protein R6V12_13810 [Candidatus Hydrogenedentota bacterium]
MHAKKLASGQTASLLFVAMLAAIGFIVCAPVVQAEEAPQERPVSEDSGDYEARKDQILARRRRVIFNNDGGDATVAREGLENPRDFLNIRTTPLADSHVDTISYCTGYGLVRVSHRTKLGKTITERKGVYANSVIPALLEARTDPLEVMVQYCHANDIEILWSMRMNDTHDASRPDRFASNTFKVNNPDCLLGSAENRPRYGGWSGVDYACQIVRDMLYQVVEEVCRNYDVDGIELDFFRHPVFFKATAQGRPVGNQEREQMTGLLRRLGKMLEREGRKRNRPFIVVARTPDDVAYCNTIGLELERWMREGLIDIWIPSGYFRLNSWDDSVRLGHRYEVKVYPGLSETRVGGGHHAHASRASDEGYRARAMNAWNAGADGVYLFNLFNPKRKIWDEMGEPEVLGPLDKVYFASVRGVGRVAGGAYPHAHFNRIATVNPDAPRSIAPGERIAVRVRIGEEFLGLPEESSPTLALALELLPNLEDAKNLRVAFNGQEVQSEGQNGWLHAALDPDAVRAGFNTVELHYTGEREDVRLADMLVSVDHSGALLEDMSYIDETRDRM